MLDSVESGRPVACLQGSPSACELARRYGWCGVVGLGALAFFFNLANYGLWEPDEGRYAEIAREMLQLRDFVVPHLNYVPYVEKPPLLYWLTALSFSALGVNEFAARAIVALSALAGLGATYYFVAKVYGWQRALLAGACLATMPLYAGAAQILTTDMLLTALVATALWALYLRWAQGGPWCWIAYVAMGMGVLTKGPVAVVIPGLVLGVFVLVRRQNLLAATARFHAIGGALLVAVIAGPWFWLVARKQPGFFDFYFVGEHLRRFAEGGYSHAGPIYFYAPLLLGGTLPWPLLLAVAPAPAWREALRRPATQFCLIAGLTVLVFFSIAASKLPLYILPALPPLAVVSADVMISSVELGAARRFAWASATAVLIGAGALIAAVFSGHLHSAYLPYIRGAVGAAGLLIALGATVSTLAFLAQRPGLGLIALLVTATGTQIVGTYGRLEAEPLRSYARLGREVASRAASATPICFRKYVQSLPFYTGRRVILVGAKTELKFGSEHSPDAEGYFFASPRDMVRLWREGSKVIVLDTADLEELAPELGNYRVIASEFRKRAVVPADEAGEQK